MARQKLLFEEVFKLHISTIRRKLAKQGLGFYKLRDSENLYVLYCLRNDIICGGYGCYGLNAKYFDLAELEELTTTDENDPRKHTCF